MVGWTRMRTRTRGLHTPNPRSSWIVFSLLVVLPLMGLTLSSPPVVPVSAGTADRGLDGGGPVVVYRLTGEITGVTAYALQDVLGTAQLLGAKLVIVELNTPGGELMAVQSIMQLFATSPVPVLVYVPTAAVAVSGGTYLLMASHVAAMGPASQIGSCQPVVGVVPTYEPKYIEFVVTLMQSHAHLHERNETVAERFIVENLNLGPTQAEELNVVELLAPSLEDLLTSLEDYTLIKRELQPGDFTFKLVATTDLDQYNYTDSWDFGGVSTAERYTYLPHMGLLLLGFLAHPVVNFILLQIGIWGFIFAINAPGQSGEIISGVCIVLALVGMGIIGISVGGILLMIIGGALLIVEAKTDIGFAGAAGAGGVACFVLGGIFFLPPSQWLIPTQAMWLFQGVAAGVALIFASLFGYAIVKAAEARKLTSEFAPEHIIGAPGVAETLLDPEGRVRALGETWTAKALDPPIKPGEPIEVVRLEGIRLIVRRRNP